MSRKRKKMEENVDVDISSLDSSSEEEYTVDKFTSKESSSKIKDEFIQHQVKQLRNNDATFKEIEIHSKGDKISHSKSKIKWKCKCGKQDMELTFSELANNSNFQYHPFYCLDCKKSDEEIFSKIYKRKSNRQDSLFCYKSKCQEAATHSTRGGIYTCTKHKKVISFTLESPEVCLVENCENKTTFSEVPGVKKYCHKHKKSMFTNTSFGEIKKLCNVLKLDKNKHILKRMISCTKSYIPSKKLDKKELLTSPKVNGVLKFMSKKHLIFEDILGEANEKGRIDFSKTFIKYLCVCQNIHKKLSVEEFLDNDLKTILCKDCYSNRKSVPLIKNNGDKQIFFQMNPEMIEEPDI